MARFVTWIFFSDCEPCTVFTLYSLTTLSIINDSLCASHSQVQSCFVRNLLERVQSLNYKQDSRLVGVEECSFVHRALYFHYVPSLRGGFTVKRSTAQQTRAQRCGLNIIVSSVNYPEGKRETYLQRKYIYYLLCDKRQLIITLL